MRMHLIPVLVLVVLPVLYLSWKWRWPRRRALRWAGGVALILLAAVALPYQGVDFLYVKRIFLFVCAGVALVLVSSRLRLGGLERPRRLLVVLAALAAFAVAAHLNFFAFHGERTFVHLHDVAHYYLGSKYYAEAGYDDLYVAMLRAQAELYDNYFRSRTARDLETYEIVDIGDLLSQRSHEVKAAFSAERWEAFQRDVEFFRGELGAQIATVTADHGFNATPVWTLFGSALSRQVDAGSRRGILALSLIDTGLLLVSFAAVYLAFGARTALLSVLFFCMTFGAGFGWTGGAFLRYLWFSSFVVGVCLFYKKRDAAAGALFALAALVRIFPALFVVPIFFRGAWKWWRHRRLPRREASFLGSFVVSALVLVALTGLLPRGFDHWSEFRKQMDLHVANISPNVVGLTDALAYQWGRPDKVTQEEFNALKVRRGRIYSGQLLLVFLPLLLLTARLARGATDMGVLALALPLLLAGLSLAGYYQVFLVLLVLWQRASLPNLALIFAVEAAAYGLMLFEDRDGLLFIYRSLLLLLLYVALFAPRVRRSLASSPV